MAEDADERDRLGKYELLGRLAVGGMAELFLARASGIDDFQKIVVLKRILPHLAEDPEFVNMFRDEARLAATLEHPNIVHVYDIGKDGDDYFFTMEYVHGQNIRDMLKLLRKRGEMFPLQHVLAIAIGVTAGLHYAHERIGYDGQPLQIVHRDVSPTNVLVTYSGGIKIVDFGIAKAAAATHVTQAGMLKGKASYMSPEQCRAENVDRRSDVFAIGILLWEMTTLTRLFRGDNELAILNKVLTHDIPPPSTVVANYPPDLEAILMRALQPDPNLRYQTVLDLQVQLEALAHKHQIHTSAAALGQFLTELTGPKPYPWTELATGEIAPRPEVLVGPPAEVPTRAEPAVGADGLPTEATVSLEPSGEPGAEPGDEDEEEDADAITPPRRTPSGPKSSLAASILGDMADVPDREPDVNATVSDGPRMYEEPETLPVGVAPTPSTPAGPGAAVLAGDTGPTSPVQRPPDTEKASPIGQNVRPRPSPRSRLPALPKPPPPGGGLSGSPGPPKKPGLPRRPASQVVGTSPSRTGKTDPQAQAMDPLGWSTGGTQIAVPSMSPDAPGNEGMGLDPNRTQLAAPAMVRPSPSGPLAGEPAHGHGTHPAQSHGPAHGGSSGVGSSPSMSGAMSGAGSSPSMSGAMAGASQSGLGSTPSMSGVDDPMTQSGVGQQEPYRGGTEPNRVPGAQGGRWPRGGTEPTPAIRDSSRGGEPGWEAGGTVPVTVIKDDAPAAAPRRGGTLWIVVTLTFVLAAAVTAILLIATQR